VAAEGHIILDTKEKDSQIKVYTIASISWFGFELTVADRLTLHHVPETFKKVIIDLE